MQGVPLEPFSLMQGVPTPLWHFFSYFKVLQGYLEGSYLDSRWGRGSSLDYRWGGIRFPNLLGWSLRPLLLILNLLYPFRLINWTLSPLWREEGLWYSYAGGISRWSLSSFGRITILIWIIGWKIAALRLGCDVPSLCNSMYLLDYSNRNSFHKHCCVDDV